MIEKKLTIFLQKWQGTVLISSSITGLLILGSYLGIFRSLEWAILDQFFRIRPHEGVAKHIVIITIDEPDIQFVKQWPMPDAVMAKLIQNIKAQQPSVMAIDVYRDLPVEPGHKELVELFQNTPNLIGIEKSAGNPIAPPPSLAKKGQVAANDLVLDADGKIRRGIILLGKPDGSLTQGLAIKLALIYLEKKGIELKEIDGKKKVYGLGNAKFFPLSNQDGFYNEADMGGYQILLNYRGGLESFPHISLRDVLENRIPKDFFRDQIVLLGSKAPSLNDNYLTPYSSGLLTPTELTPGVAIHANLLSQILKSALNNRPMLRAAIKPIHWLMIGFWSGYGAILGSFYIHRRWLTLSGLWLAIVIIFSSSFMAFLIGWLVPVFTPVLAVMIAAIVSVGQVLWQNLLLSYRQLEDYAQNLEKKVEERTAELFLEKEKSERLLLNILPEVIARELKEEQHSIADYFSEATILFSDIVGFTPLSSRISPIELVSLLNQMFSIFDQLAEKHGLEKIKTIGDAYMVVGGLPIPREDHTEAVAEMALEMQDALTHQFQVEWDETFEIRVGIHTGPVVAGVIGTKKFIYDLWGDTVNVASRMESSGKPSRIQVTADTYEKLKTKFLLEERGLIQVKGKGEMRTYWLLGKKE
jgi:CHASE2 domain-containing sensor protein/class 3 adenylate cyclase